MLKRILLVSVCLVGAIWIFLGPKKTPKEPPTFPVTEEKPFVIITPSFNNIKWCERNLSSVFEQNYKNYRLIYIDDCSTDGTGDKVSEIIAKSGKGDKVQLIRNKINKGAMENFYHAIHSCSDKEIIVCLDGDDWLAHDKVLTRLNESYANPDIWLTYGGYMEYPTYQKGDYSRPFPTKVIKNNEFRSYKIWSASHIRTFYAGLFKKVRMEDFFKEGDFLKVSCDVAMMIPMLEMAGDRFGFIKRKEVLYIYNHANPLNDDMTRWQAQQDTDRYIRSLPKYQPLPSFESKPEDKKNVTHESEFDLLMGKETHHWNHLKLAEDKALLSAFKEMYESNKKLQFAKTDDLKIPKTVHFIWLGPKQFPPQSVENIRTWMAHNPDWSFKFWTDRERAAPCNGMETIVIKDYPFPYLKRCYEISQNWGEKSDCLRFEILYQEGGVYADHDANCLKSFDSLHRTYDLYCGLEMPHLPMGGYAITLGNGVIGSCSLHPTIKQVIDTISSRWDDLEKKYEGRDPFSRSQIVIERTYLALTLAMKDVLGKSGKKDIVLPAAYFFAKQGVKPVYSKHFFANSWAGGVNEKVAFEKKLKSSLQKIEQKINNGLMFSWAILMFNIIILGFSVFFIRGKRA